MTGTWPVMHIRAKRGRRKPSPNSKCLETALSQLLSSQPSLGTVSLCDGKKPSDIRWCLVSDTRPQGLTVNRSVPTTLLCHSVEVKTEA